MKKAWHKNSSTGTSETINGFIRAEGWKCKAISAAQFAYHISQAHKNLQRMKILKLVSFHSYIQPYFYYFSAMFQFWIRRKKWNNTFGIFTQFVQFENWIAKQKPNFNTKAYRVWGCKSPNWRLPYSRPHNLASGVLLGISAFPRLWQPTEG